MKQVYDNCKQLLEKLLSIYIWWLEISKLKWYSPNIWLERLNLVSVVNLS